MSLAFSFLPVLVLFTKITPHGVEASVFAMLTGLFNFSSGVGGPMFGSFLCKLFGVTTEKMDDYYKLILVQMLCISMSFFIIKLVPTKREIEEKQKREIEKMNREQETL